MIYRSLFVSAAFIAMISSSLALAQDVSALAGKQEITFTTDTIYPESASWSNKRGAFFVGSVAGIVGVSDARKRAPGRHPYCFSECFRQGTALRLDLTGLR